MLRWETPNEGVVEFDLSPDDIRDYVRHTMLGTPHARRALAWSRGVLLVIITGLTVLRVAAQVGLRAALPAAVISLVVGVPVAWFAPVWVRQTTARGASERQIQNTKGLGHWVFVADLEGLHHTHPMGTGFVPWRAIHRIDLTATGVYLFTQPMNAHVIPAHAFGNAGELEDFVRFCEGRMQGTSVCEA